jgi:hypothetical protein
LVNQDSALNRAKRQVCDPLFNKMDLHVLLQVSHVVLQERRVTIMLLNMSSAILLKVKFLLSSLLYRVLRVERMLENMVMILFPPKKWL